MVVRPPKSSTIRSPKPWNRFLVWASSPTPNASSTTTATVPQVMPRMVSAVRSFCALRSARNSRNTLLQLFDRFFGDLLAALEAALHLDVDRVRQPGLDGADLGPAVGQGDRDRGGITREGDHALGYREDTVAPRDDDVGVRGIAGAERR